MRPEWFADKRDLVKWAVLYHLACKHECKMVMQIAFYRDSQFGKIMIDDEKTDFPLEVETYFRRLKDLENILNLTANFKIGVFMKPFNDRKEYFKSVIKEILKYGGEKLAVFLDPDTGFTLKKPDPEHVSAEEVKKILTSLKSGDMFVFYQHQFHDKDWIRKISKKLEDAISRPVKIGKADDKNKDSALAKDVVFFYSQKP